MTQVIAVDPLDEEALARAFGTAGCIIDATSELVIDPTVEETWSHAQFKKYVYPGGTFWDDKSPDEIHRILNGIPKTHEK